MKKILFGIITTILISTAASAQTYLESTAFIAGKRVQTSTGGDLTAKTLILENFDSKYTPASFYVINGIDFTDDGKNNDKISGDGIYTSVKVFKKPVALDPDVAYVFVSDTFKYMTALKTKASVAGKVGITISCKSRIVYSGHSVLGFSCASGCIEFYDCTFEFEIGW